MDRLNQLRGEAGGSGDSTLDTTSPPSETYMSANESSSKYFSLSDSTFDMTPIKDVSLASTSAVAGGPSRDTDELMPNLSPIEKKEMLDTYKIGKQIEAANILSGGVNIFDDNENSFDGDELVIDDNVDSDEKSNPDKTELTVEDPTLVEDVASKDMEVVLQIDGKNVNAIDIGNGLYLYRKDGQEELAAVQIIDGDQPQPSFKFLKVRENAEGNLEVYEEIEIEVPKEVPAKEGKPVNKNTPHVPIKDINKVTNDHPSSNKITERKYKSPQKETMVSTTSENVDEEKDTPEVNFNGKMVKINECRKSPVVGSFTPMTFHSTPNKEGKPLTKTMVDLQLDPNRHTDLVKKTIEVHTDVKQKSPDPISKEKDLVENTKLTDTIANYKVTEKFEIQSDTETLNLDKIADREKSDTVPGEKEKSDGFNVQSSNDRQKNKQEDSVIAGNDTIENLKVEEPTVVHRDNNTKNVESDVFSLGKLSLPNIESRDVESNTDINTKSNKYIDGVDTPLTALATIESSASKVQQDEPKQISTSLTVSTTTSRQVPDVASSETEEDSRLIKSVEKIESEENFPKITPDEPENKPTLSKICDQEPNVGSSEITDSLKHTEIPDHVYSIPKTISTNIENKPQISKSFDQVPKVEPKKIVPNFTIETGVSDPQRSKTSEQLETLKSPDQLQTLKSDQVAKLETSERKPDSIKHIEVSEHAYSLIKTDNKPDTSKPSCQEPKVESSATLPDSIKLIDLPLITSKSTPIEMKNKSQIPESSSGQVLQVESLDSKPDSIKLNDGLDPDVPTPKIMLPDRENKLQISKKQEKPSNSSHEVLKLEPSVTKSDSIKPSDGPESSLSIPKSMSSDENKVHKIKISDQIPKVESSRTKHEQDEKKSDNKSTDISRSKIPTLSQITIEKSTVDVTMPKVKPPEPIKPSIVVPKIKTSEIPRKSINVDASARDGKATPLSAPIIKAVEVKVTEAIGQAVPLPKIKFTEISRKNIPVSKPAGLPIVPKVEGVEPSGQSIPVPKHKATELEKHNMVQLKTNSVVKSESKYSGLKDKTTKPSNLIIEASSKPSSIDHGVKQPKTGEIIKINDKANHPIESLNKNNQIKSDSKDTKDPNKKLHTEQKPVNNNHTPAVPFGKWTEVNRQEFLNKFKEVKAPVNTNTKQIKNSNDLNRRDVLKKIDSQRQQTIINNATSKAPEKLNIKNESVFSSKTVPDKKEPKKPEKNESTEIKPTQIMNKVSLKQDHPQKAAVSSSAVTSATDLSAPKAESAPRKDLSTATMASLIDRTIEDMITRVVPMKNVDETNLKKTDTIEQDLSTQETSQPITTLVVDDPGTLDDIEMKMNELHGIPFVERPAHELPKVLTSEIKTYSKSDKTKPHIKSTKVSSIDQKIEKNNVIEVESDEEAIEHEPITGDMDLNKINIPHKLPEHEKSQPISKNENTVLSNKDSKKESIITENEFDKFARRNSITYENCLTVNFDKKDLHNVVEIVKEKEITGKHGKEKETHIKSYLPKNEIIRIEPKPKLPLKQPFRQNIHISKTQSANSRTMPEDVSNKNSQSKIHNAYQSALTAKRQVNPPITILEDKPVKVMFLDSSTGFVPSQLNVQGQELSPPKKLEPALDIATNSNTNSVDSDILEAFDENKQLDKIKTKHQRKQVLTPVEAPELELIQPIDISVEGSPKKKRKIEEHKTDKQSKNLVHKKSYLLGRNSNTDVKNLTHTENVVEHKNTASAAIDSLVKAAELLENQADTLNQNLLPLNSDNQQNTPVKRGRGRPRKYPLSEGSDDKKQPSPQKKPRLIDAKPVKKDSISDENDDEDSDTEIVRENWTMGKINENIVCPICNKLFRSENVVFKHVKHCTGVSPNRSESDKSLRRGRSSQDFDDIEDDHDKTVDENKKKHPKKRKSSESVQGEMRSEPIISEENDDIIVINDTPEKEKPDKQDKEKDTSKILKTKAPLRASDICCEICGKTFRQQSYLANHKLQHKREQTKKLEKDARDSHKPQVFGCEVCKKEFRKLHHLVQHRNIHETDSASTRSLRKSSPEQNDTKNLREEAASRQNEDQSAAFRCEPCDKSFRKLHHLVEHRETHDGINRQKISASVQPPVEKPDPPPQCEVCKKTFRKLHHLIEHKEQHNVIDTSSDRSDDKSVKSSSLEDIIHECSLCYMVFPNEHSLNKHSTLCAKKKRQSKQPKDNVENESEKNDDRQEDSKTESKIEPKSEGIIDNTDVAIKETDNIHEAPIIVEKVPEILNMIPISEVKRIDHLNEETRIEQQSEVSTSESQNSKQNSESDHEKIVEKCIESEKIIKTDQKENVIKEEIRPLKKKTPLQNKVPKSVTKRQKSVELPVKPEAVAKITLESSDDDDNIRYMLNPNYKVDDTSESKKFMKIRSSKRNSLQIERTRSTEFVTRRTSVQHPPKTPRLRPKSIDAKLKVNETEPTKEVEAKSKTVEPKIMPKPKIKPIIKSMLVSSQPVKNQKEAEAVMSTDSEDSDIKYSFPKTSKISKLAQERTSKVEKKEKKNIPRKSSADKLKSIGGVAKRKSMEKVTTKHKINASPAKTIKKRSRDVEHRCDCGQLFSSAALLARHTSLAHTPPRIRRRRSPPPEPAPEPAPKPSPKPSRRSRTSTDKNNPPKSRKSTNGDAASSAPVKSEDSRKPDKATAPKTTRRSAAHSGVPVPEKMRRVMQKMK